MHRHCDAACEGGRGRAAPVASRRLPDPVSLRLKIDVEIDVESALLAWGDFRTFSQNRQLGPKPYFVLTVCIVLLDIIGVWKNPIFAGHDSYGSKLDRSCFHRKNVGPRRRVDTSEERPAATSRPFPTPAFLVQTEAKVGEQRRRRTWRPRCELARRSRPAAGRRRVRPRPPPPPPPPPPEGDSPTASPPPGAERRIPRGRPRRRSRAPRAP